MIRRTLTILSAAFVLLAVPSLVLADDEASEPIPITDPVLLEQLGFASDATNVYTTQRVLRKMAMSPEERAATQEGLLDDPEASPAGGPYGTGTYGYTPVHGSEFYPPVNPSGSASWTTSSRGRYCTGGTSTYRAQIHGLPHGADLRQVSVWVYDANSADVTVGLYRSCQPDGDGGPQVSHLLDADSDPNTAGHLLLNLGCIPDFGDFPPTLCPIQSVLHETIDLESCVYFVQANLGACDSSLAITKARARWQRQLSPAPATATFDDVPTGHLFFQHVEALAGSGITAGCDADSFCPNAPLTRGQMATFLAKALGLHWDNVAQP